MILFWLVALAMIALVGCGAGSLRVHAGAVVATAGVHRVAFASIDTARDAALDQVEAEHPTAGPERAAAIRAEAARWTPIGAALDGVRTLLQTWAQTLELVRLAESDELELDRALLPLAARAVVLWDVVVRLAGSLGVELPALPDGVRKLALVFAEGD